MAHIAFTCPSKIREQTSAAREKKAHSLSALQAYSGCGAAPAWSLQNGMRVHSSARGSRSSTTTCSPMLGSLGRSK